MLSTSDFKKGVRLEYEGQPWILETVRSQSPSARGAATLIKVRMRNVLTGQISDKTFKAGEKFQEPDLQLRPAQYLYAAPDGDQTTYYFMDNANYEQFELSEAALDDQRLFLVENLEVKALLYNDRVVGVELPQFVEMEMEDVAPGSRGDTASGGVSTTGTTVTGVKIQVPLFIKPGDVVRIDTTTGQFKDRVKGG
ncbi:elongation factor P [Myxococcota bacterium]|nr:elongation factor P [Myxococcota bacterium]MBU1432214.1 elongation factor P [Myxococcota bacterium]MBU1900415.1 elongation factor P [Myxococcota bacterium]